MSPPHGPQAFGPTGDLARRYAQIQAACQAHGATLVAVTKHASLAQMRQIADLGVRDVGENRVGDALAKMEALGPALTSTLRWHLIGHLQRNKAAHTVGRFHLIHSVDSCALAERLSALNTAQGLLQPILLQVNIAQEPQKTGFSPDALTQALARIRALPGVRVDGLMTMTPLGADAARANEIFTKLNALRHALADAFCAPLPHLSMGMSQDYIHALAQGATIVRVGSVLFGEGPDPLLVTAPESEFPVYEG